MEAEFLTIIGTIIGTFIASLAIIVTIVVTMFTNLGAKIDSFQSEMRDLHGRVAKIEAKIQR